jgi:hypothetical protein
VCAAGGDGGQGCECESAFSFDLGLVPIMVGVTLRVRNDHVRDVLTLGT